MMSISFDSIPVICIVSFSLYYVLSLIYPKSQLPILITTFVFTNMVSRTSLFKSLTHSASRSIKSGIPSLANLPTSSGANYSKFQSLNKDQKIEVLSAIKSLKSYQFHAQDVNERRKSLFTHLASKQQSVAKDVGYWKKLELIDKAIEKNQNFVDAVGDFTIEKYGVSLKDFDLIENAKGSIASGNNFRVIEALGHYTRDWTTGSLSPELRPIFDYVASQLELAINFKQKHDTVLVFPGSGLGRLAYEFSKWDYGAVYSIENSGLMNSFVGYNYGRQTKKSHTIYPYIHTSSDYYNTESQLRTFEYEPIGEVNKPKNLHIVNEDFTKFEIPNRDKYKNVVVVSVFFLDTAENLFTYLETIEKLAKPSGNVERGYWINAGPLKYGSAAQVEFNADELKEARKALGWVDEQEVYTIWDPLSVGNKTGLVGYLTDKESMWQGYYGLNLFTTSRKENKSYRV
ncbi:hypothetical protein CORT_0A05310 [Candida orthopsilosis Co 90-125]|uniref:Uncharacterized protein n=1 Tax=Candida orthopsilosis (strain 90-125) TaxID=1136231 RepID=H8WXX2_CANO9|nr:hypothetical protein CORT_0A05310 [Candida orthopsilosis Co 90-125]CCG20919.1 hypothetical protein CORT_0A05310 [Candida orthopsilosis Co 90-125]